jgi:hypothetical protein
MGSKCKLIYWQATWSISTDYYREEKKKKRNRMMLRRDYLLRHMPDRKRSLIKRWVGKTLALFV